jgi:hypothetical protein
MTKTSIKYKDEKVELDGDSIFVYGVVDAFYEFDSKEYAEEVWKEILQEWKKCNYYSPTGLLRVVDCICDSRKYSLHLTYWP